MLVGWLVLSNAQRTPTTKNRSENEFVCADFCSDIKSLRSFLRVAYEKKIGQCALTSVREKIGVTSSNNRTSPIIVTHNSSDKKSVRVR